MLAAALPWVSRCLLACCWLLPSGFSRAQSATAPTALGRIARIGFFARQAAELTGTYQGQAAKNDPARRVFTLDLAADGTATLTTLYIGRENAHQYGRWASSGNQIVLTFNAVGSYQPPRPITFRHRDHELSPLRWDQNEWGRSGPPVLHRARSVDPTGVPGRSLR